MERISRKNSGFQSVSDIPTKYKKYEGLYGHKNRKGYIPENFRRNIFAIVDSEGNDKNVYILVYYPDAESRAEIVTVIRAIIADYQGDANTYPENAKFGEIGSQQLCKTIIDELATRESKLKKKKANNDEESDRARRLTKMAEKTLKDAMEMKASDLHIESDGTRAVIRLRINKELTDHQNLTHSDAVDMANIFYSSFTRGSEEDQEKGSGDGVYNHTNLLDGEFSRTIDNIKMKARMVNIGQNYGDSFTKVLRLIDKSKASTPQNYPDMSFSKDACERFKSLQTASRGMILIVGVTGSGKSTTMQNMIMHERDRCGRTRKIYSLEQPIEQQIEGVVQVNTADSQDENSLKNKDSSLDFSFDSLNRRLMRGDPDTIVYGEIRDNQTAKAAVKGVESGHLVYGTMHVSEVMGIFSRFETFGVDAEKLCRKSFIKMAIFQHLIPKLCKHCSISYKIGDSIPKQFGEFYAAKSFKRKDGRSLDMSRILPMKKSLKPGESLIRAMQKNGTINTEDTIKMIRHIGMINDHNNSDQFQKRLNNLMRSSAMPEKDINVRFRGDGCPHCFNGASGVVPVVEILQPDEKFLDLILNKKLNKAEMHWKSKLGGRSSTEDSYSKIMTGVVDPRNIEEELDEIGK
jgi:type II secretory ATPase GspE/PulE/Tfp pilus assembly ATPase PilB-like protein